MKKMPSVSHVKFHNLLRPKIPPFQLVTPKIKKAKQKQVLVVFPKNKQSMQPVQPTLDIPNSIHVYIPSTLMVQHKRDSFKRFLDSLPHIELTEFH